MHWFLRLVVESLDAHRDPPEMNPFLPFANFKRLPPVGREENRAPAVWNVDQAEAECALPTR
jgi:hypothetical protein